MSNNNANPSITGYNQDDNPRGYNPSRPETSDLQTSLLLDLYTIDLPLDHLTDPRLLNDPMLLKILGSMREVDLMMMKGILGMMMRILLVWMMKMRMMVGVILDGNKD